MKTFDAERLQTLFAAALELPREERREMLARECADDAALLAEIESLLEADAEFSATTAPPIGAKLAGLIEPLAPQPDLCGRRVGAYVLLDVLGSGGMGVVYRAARADGEVTQDVAIKVLRGGVLDVEARERFRRERDLLARFNHPHIARLYDAGVTGDGQPYFVMEYVHGTSITAYCDQRRLGIDARLRLFLQVCDAVRYAHQQLVLHRDIKPSNVLIDEQGLPKLIDFGIARPLQPEAVTLTQHRFFSPLNAAPEQLQGEAMGVACDVYQLGTLLYEMLCGRPIFDLEGKTAGSIEKAILHQLPQLPSARIGAGDAALAQSRRCHDAGALQRQLRGDLDEIALLALRKEPERRYASVEQLMEDVERHLQELPVQARGSDRLYRTGRWFRRNAIGVTVATAALLALFSGLALLWLQARSLERERDHARAQTALAQQQGRRAEFLTTFLLEAFAQADPSHSMGQTLTAKQILEAGVRQLHSADESDPESLVRIAITLAEVEYRLGLYDEGNNVIDFSKERLATIAYPSSAVIAAQHYVEGLRLEHSSKFNQVRQESEAGLALLDKQNDAWSQQHWVALKTLLARALVGTDDVAGALAIRRELVASIGEMQWLRRDDAWGLRIDLATLLNRTVDTRGEARSIMEEVLRELASAHATDTPTNAGALRLFSSIETRSGNEKTPREYAEKSLAIYQKIYGAEHAVIAQALNTLAGTEADSGDTKLALEHWEHALRILERTGPPSNLSVGILYNMAIMYDEPLQDYPRAEQYFRQAIEGFRKVLGDDHSNVIIAESGLAHVLIEDNRHNEAGPLLERELRHWEKVDPSEENLSSTRCAIALVRHAQGRDSEAIELLRNSLAAFRKYALPSNYMLKRADSLAQLLNVQVEPAK